jgi:hypothetical protein
MLPVFVRFIRMSNRLVVLKACGMTLGSGYPRGGLFLKQTTCVDKVDICLPRWRRFRVFWW